MTDTTWFQEQGDSLVANYRDAGEALVKFSFGDKARKRGLAEYANQARRTASELNRLACDLADAAGGLDLPPWRHYEELLAEVRNGEHVEVDA